MADPDLFPWEKPYVEDPRRAAADDQLATMGMRMENIARAMNALAASRSTGDLPEHLATPAIDALRLAQVRLGRLQRVRALNYDLDFSDDVEHRAVIRDQLQDLAIRWAGDADLLRRIHEGG